MKSKKSQDDQGWSSQSGSGNSGKEVKPSELQEENQASKKITNQPAPMGIPVSEEEYRKMKETSIQKELPPDEHAQEDSPG